MSNTAFHLTGKTIFIAGASSGIGRQIAISVSQMGGTLVISGRNEERLNETLSQLEGTGHSIAAADLLNEEQRLQLVSALPKLDGVVYCSGVVKAFPIKFLSQEKIDETLNINYESPVLLMAGILKAKKLNAGASLVFLSSISSQHPHKGGAMYSGAKAALESFSKVLALELYSKHIRSNCISPAMVKTEMYDTAEKDVSKEIMDAHVAKYPLGVGTPEDVANTAIFLLSDASKWITGINITLDGGFLLQG